MPTEGQTQSRSGGKEDGTRRRTAGRLSVAPGFALRDREAKENEPKAKRHPKVAQLLESNGG
ncbi:hypothetical protein GCM10028813_09250 [Ramlibacter alkalitolerans]